MGYSFSFLMFCCCGVYTNVWQSGYLEGKSEVEIMQTSRRCRHVTPKKRDIFYEIEKSKIEKRFLCIERRRTYTYHSMGYPPPQKKKIFRTVQYSGNHGYFSSSFFFFLKYFFEKRLYGKQNVSIVLRTTSISRPTFSIRFSPVNETGIPGTHRGCG